MITLNSKRVNLALRFISALLGFVALAGSTSAHAQVVASAEQKRWSLSAGAVGSSFQPDYAGVGVAQTSPTQLYGVGVYVDWKLSRLIQTEGEIRYEKFNQYLNINETTYEFGPRIPIVTFKRITPHGKLLFGFGTGSFLVGKSALLTYGGGVDYRLSRKLTLRPFDVEYQRWNVKNVAMFPYGISAGVSYRIF